MRRDSSGGGGGGGGALIAGHWDELTMYNKQTTVDGSQSASLSHPCYLLQRNVSFFSCSHIAGERGERHLPLPLPLARGVRYLARTSRDMVAIPQE